MDDFHGSIILQGVAVNNCFYNDLLGRYVALVTNWVHLEKTPYCKAGKIEEAEENRAYSKADLLNSEMHFCGII